MKIIFALLIFITAFIVGLGIIPTYFLAISFIISYIDSIMFGHDQVDGFESSSPEEFRQKDKVVKTAFFGSVVLILIVYGLGRLLSWIF